MKCTICQGDFNDKCGAFSRHLIDVHHITREEYVIISEHRGVAPICECGYCNETPEYYRGSFRKYFKGHNTFEWRNAKYIEKHNPKCILCGNIVGFRRSSPNKLCNNCISIEGSGFSSSIIRKSIAIGVSEKYGVDNVMKVDQVKERHLNSIHKIDRNWKISEGTKRKHSDNMTTRWTSESYRNLVIPKIIEAVRKPVERDRRREYVLNRILHEPGYLIKLIGYCRCRTKTSKLHIKVRNKLELGSLGFESECRIGRYVADELNSKSKVIIEINGDYIHANPKIYKPDSLIITHQGHYSAETKWEYDMNRKLYLESLGYVVIVIWESDLPDIDKMNSHLNTIRRALLVNTLD